jgi:hypothetical protein
MDHQESKTAPSAVRVPLILGVTGHRDIPPDDWPRLKECIRGIVRDLQHAYPHTPLMLLSPLAEGADRLAAEVALEPDLNMRLIAVLPWPDDSCPEGVCRLDDREDFDRLIAGAAQTVTLPLLEGVQQTELVEETVRRRHYDQVGRFIARHSQILIALWDGIDSPESSTARVIRWQREGTPAPLAIRHSGLDEVERGPVFRIVTQRMNGPRPSDPFSVMIEWPAPKEAGRPGHKPPLFWHRLAQRLDEVESLPVLEWSRDNRPAGERECRRVWEILDRFNSDAGFVEKECSRQLEINKGHLVPTEMQPGLPADLRDLLEIYARADTAAGCYQTATFRNTTILFFGAFMAVVVLEIYAHFFSQWWVLGIHLILLLTGYSLYRRAQRNALQPRYLDYRALAEALRVQVAWQWAGLRDSVADHYLRHFRGDLDWIRLATRTCFLLSQRGDVVESQDGPGDALQRLRLVRERWIEDQRTFFAKRGPWNEGQELLFQLMTRYLFRLAVLLAIALVVIHIVSSAAGHASGADASHGISHTLHHGLILALFCALVLSALFEDYADYAGYAIHSRKYHWMAGLYTTAREQLDAALVDGDVAKARALLWELGKEALAENADWVVQHRDRLPIWHGG